MLNLDPSKLLVIAIVMLIVLGPDKLPHFARQLGGAWRSLSAFRQRMESEVRSSVPDLPSTTELAGYVRSPAALLDHLSATERFDEPTRAGLDDAGELPVLGRNEDQDWTRRSLSERRAGRVDSDAENTCLEARAPFVGDATLN